MKNLCFVLLLTVSFAGKSQHSIDVDQLTTELQKSSGDPDRINLVWWIPNEFWEASVEAGAELDDIINSVGKYTIFAIVEGRIGSFGGSTFLTKEEVEETVVLSDAYGDVYMPLKEKKIDNNTTMLLSMMKPIFVNLLGAMGENIHFYVFEGFNRKNDRLLDPLKGGNFKIKVLEEEYEWETPLGSLLPAKICPKDDKPLNGAWSYCPWHGDKLIEKPR